ncbi:MAG: DUF72 domain-containing protein [Acidobacteria bacterium]|nr:DUF72 domain-containing protein [Acidobacteriota bacterium]
MITVGTSGFQYRDWASVFYPGSLDPKLRLRYYSRRFGCCELGATVYRIPEAIMIQELVEETGGDFQFVFRAPFRLAEEHPDNPELARRFAAALWPVKAAGRLAGALLQFPPGFGFMRDNFDRLCRVRDLIEGIALIAEFGCPDWLSPRAAKHMAAERIALACVDGGERLAEKTFFCATAEPAYVRFQGRNSSRWVKGDGSARHDYLYSRVELAAAVAAIRRLEQQCERVLVFFGNHWRGQAVVNARMLLEELSGALNGERETGNGKRK